MKMNLKTKIISKFLLLIIGSLIVLGGTSYYMSYKSLQSSESEQLRATASQVATAITTKTETAKNYFKIVSDNNTIADVIVSDNEINKNKVHKYLKDVCKQVDGLFEWVYVTDTEGKDIVDDKTTSPTKDLSDRKYVKDALNGKEAVSSEILKSKVSGKPIIGVAYPIKVNGKIVGVLGGTVLFDKISDIASKVKMGKSGYIYMINRNGLVIYHPIRKNVLKLDIDDVKNEELQKLAKSMKQGKSGEGFYTYNGEYKHVGFTPADSWTVIVTAPYNEYMHSAISIRNDTIVIVLFAIVIAVILSIIISNGIVNPIKKIKELMKKAGEGDITVRAAIKTGDELEELGESFNYMIQSQSNIIKNVRLGSKELCLGAETIAASSEQISAGTEQINTSMQQVAANTETQNAKILEVSQVLVQVSSLVHMAQNKALAADKNSIHTMEVAKFGRKKVSETVEAINMISKCTNETDGAMENLDQLSKKVGGIIVTINAIAEQTNMLALNAAIEAARAGEYGNGFTVVSEQIRKLSEQSNAGANEIAILVNKMIEQTQKAVVSMHSAKKAVENGVCIANDTDQSFIKIIDATEETASNVREIVDVTEDEVATSDQIVKLIDSIASTIEENGQMTEEVAAAVEQSSSANESLAATAQETNAMAVSLEDLVEEFKIEEEK